MSATADKPYYQIIHKPLAKSQHNIYSPYENNGEIEVCEFGIFNCLSSGVRNKRCAYPSDRWTHCNKSVSNNTATYHYFSHICIKEAINKSTWNDGTFLSNLGLYHNGSEETLLPSIYISDQLWPWSPEILLPTISCLTLTYRHIEVIRLIH